MNYKDTGDFINSIAEISAFKSMQNIYKGKILMREKEKILVQIGKDIKVTSLLLRLGTKESFIEPKAQVGDSVLVFATTNAGLLAIPFTPSVEEKNENRVFCKTVEFGEKNEKANIVAGGENIFTKLLEGLNAVKKGLEDIVTTLDSIGKIAGAATIEPACNAIGEVITPLLTPIKKDIEDLGTSIKSLNNTTL